MEEIKEENKKSNHIVSVSIFLAINFILVFLTSLFVFSFDKIRGSETGIEGLGLIPLLIIGLFIMGVFIIVELVLMILSLCFSVKSIKLNEGKVKVFHIIMIVVHILIFVFNIIDALVLFEVI
ncbi:MAG: hypothetical protein ACI4U5_01810 [Bacilli bacterium]